MEFRFLKTRRYFIRFPGGVKLEFVDSFGRDGFPDWQLGQAEDAARIFVVNFRTIERKHRSMRPFQRHSVDAVAQSRRLGAIRKDMTQMRVTDAASRFHATHTMAAIHVVSHYARRQGLAEAGPAGAAVELGVGIEQWRIAAHAAIATRLENSAHWRTVRWFGAFVARDAVLLVGELRPPVRVGFLDPARRWRVAVLCPVNDIAPLNKHFRGFVCLRIPFCVRCLVTLGQSPTRSWIVACITVGKTLQVILVLGFRFPEWSGQADFRDYFAGPQSGRIHISNGFHGCDALRSRGVENRGAIRRAPIIALPVSSAWVVNLEKKLQQVSVRQDIGIEHDFYGLGVRAMIAIGGVGHVATRVSDAR